MLNADDERWTMNGGETMTVDRADAEVSPAAAGPGAAHPGSRRTQTRSRLLDAAVEVFAEAGLQGASVESICARAGFTRGAFYSNFSSKEELFLALHERELERRAHDLAARAVELEPLLRGRRSRIAPAQAAHVIAEFFAPASDATEWYALETEFLLLALRDPETAPRYRDYTGRFASQISAAVARIIAAGGRRFTLPVERAVQVLSGEYERALRAEALGGERAEGGLDGLSERLSEVLFAITEEAPARPRAAAE